MKFYGNKYQRFYGNMYNGPHPLKSQRIFIPELGVEIGFDKVNYNVGDWVSDDRFTEDHKDLCGVVKAVYNGHKYELRYENGVCIEWRYDTPSKSGKWQSRYPYAGCE